MSQPSDSHYTCAGHRGGHSASAGSSSSASTSTNGSANSGFCADGSANSGFRADGLSTALFVMGREKAEEYHRLHNNFDYVILTDDNKAYVTKGSEKSFSVANGHDYAVKVVE